MRGLTDEQRKALDAASAAALQCEAGGGAEPPRDAVRAVDNVRTTRPDRLVHSREPGETRVLIEVKSIAFGISRYSTRWHLDGATWTERRAAGAVKERDAAAAAIDAEVFAGVVPPPMPQRLNREKVMWRAVSSAPWGLARWCLVVAPIPPGGSGRGTRTTASCPRKRLEHEIPRQPVTSGAASAACAMRVAEVLSATTSPPRFA
jgi:hypothetical protein